MYVSKFVENVDHVDSKTYLQNLKLNFDQPIFNSGFFIIFAPLTLYL